MAWHPLGIRGYTDSKRRHNGAFVMLHCIQPGGLKGLVIKPSRPAEPFVSGSPSLLTRKSAATVETRRPSANFSKAS